MEEKEPAMSYDSVFPEHEPYGTGVGVMPGRVVWANMNGSYSSGATKDSYTNLECPDSYHRYIHSNPINSRTTE